MPRTGYLVGDSSGWLRVKSEGSGTIVERFADLKIDIGCSAGLAMARPSVSRPFFRKLAIGIGLGLLGTVAANAQAPRPLTQDELLGNPAAVATWLRDNASRADRKTAATFAKLGAKYKARGDWSGASKAYGESAIHYPDPVVVLEYARVRTLDLASVRAYNKRPDLIASDATSFLKLYQVVHAAQGQLGSLSSHQAAKVEQAIQCLSAPGAASQVPTHCGPLKAYRAEFDRISKKR